MPRLGTALVALYGLALLECSTSAPRFSPAATQRGVTAAGLVDGELLKTHIAKICEGRAAEDAPAAPVALRERLTRASAATYMVDAFTGLGLAPKLETGTLSVGESTSVVAEIPGALPELVLVTGHYDAWFGTGADDNASALAVMIETARVLADTKPKRTIRFVAFDREEEGILGSALYQRAHANDPIRMVVNMDCVGYASDAKDSQETPPGLGLRDRGTFLAAIANEPAETALTRLVGLSADVPRFVDTVGLLAPGGSRNPATGPFLQSDHVAFWDASVPAIFLTDTASFRNPNYHTADDLPDTLDYDFLARVGQLTAGAVAAFAEQD